MTLYLRITPAEPPTPAAAPASSIASVGVIRGWRRHRGVHARPRRVDAGDAVTWALAALVAAAGVLTLGPKVAAADDGPPDTPPRLQLVDGDARGAMAAAATWAALLERRDYAAQYDTWSASARAEASRADYLAAQRCAPPTPAEFVVTNVRVDEVTVYGDTATAWYWGESFRSVGPIKLRSATWHLYQLLRWEDGAWRHEPGEHLEGILAREVQVGVARCRASRTADTDVLVGAR